MLLSLLLLLTVVFDEVFMSESNEHLPAFRHSIIILKMTSFDFYRRQLTIQESQFIVKEARIFERVARHRTKTPTFDEVKKFYMQTVENAIKLNAVNRPAKLSCNQKKKNYCSVPVNWGDDRKDKGWFYTEYGMSKDYINQMPLVDQTGTISTQPNEERKWRCEDSIGHPSDIKKERQATKVTQKEAELSTQEAISAEVSASLEVSYAWLSLSVDASHSEEHGSSSSKLSSEMKSTSFKVTINMSPNKVYYTRDQTVPIEMDRGIHVPFEATGWVRDWVGNYGYTIDDDQDQFYLLKEAIAFPVGDMAYYFPTLMKRINSNAMIFYGPEFNVSGYKNEHVFHIKEFDATGQHRCR